MTPEEIRAEAIDRIARASYAAWKHQYDVFEHASGFNALAPGYDDWPRWPERESSIVTATRAIDALGDLLPTGEEISTCFPDEPAADDEARRRYVTDWRCVE
ncbi:hypothetical protein ACFVH4_18955 [Nocardia ignorata]|uniref:hypothetical protein n=1 Tax=Nocardia ignorata TaxID=145285 RepID=UPI00363C3904